jgi:hypothetical protein
MNFVFSLVLAAFVFVEVQSKDNLTEPYVANDYKSAAYRLYHFPNDTEPELIVGPAWATPSPGYNLVATIVVNRSFNDFGWDFVQVTPERYLFNNESDTDDAYYFSGYLEGFTTAASIVNAMIASANAPTPNAKKWIAEHIKYMQDNVEANIGQNYSSPFWTQVGYLLSQVEGLADGYAAAAANAANVTSFPNITFFDMFLLSFTPEISDVETAVGNTMTSEREGEERRTTQQSARRRFRDESHCSALVKVVDDDIYFSHVTWSSYGFMYRQYKIYEFQTTVSMSGYPGQIVSGDDWYILSSKMAVQETTNGYFIDQLAINYVKPNTVSEFLRVMTANFVAQSGAEWVSLFAYNNSGTYCNQYMILDYKLYQSGDKGSALKKDLLWVSEQMPGNVTSADVTEVLRATSYWASFNTPYFKNIYDNSGFAYQEEQWGPLFSYTKYARPEIFSRNHSMVHDLESMKRMMRYNDWQHDPLSAIPLCPKCSPPNSPTLAIANRGDLVPAYTVLPQNASYAAFFNGSSPFGAIDAKIASLQMFNNSMQGVAVCGPTTDQQPIFNWTKQFPGQQCPGCAEAYNFSWQFFNRVDLDTLYYPKPPNRVPLIVGLSVGIPLTFVALGLVFWKGVKCRKRPENIDEEKQKILQ